MEVRHRKSARAGRLRVPRSRAVFRVSDLKQLQRDQVAPTEAASSAIFATIGRDRALEELVDVQIPCPDRATSPAAELPALFQV